MRQRHKEPERLQKWLTAVTTATKRISAINRRLTHKSSRTLFWTYKNQVTWQYSISTDSVDCYCFSFNKYYEGEVLKYDDTNKYYIIKYLDDQQEDLDQQELKQHRKTRQQYSRQQYISRAQTAAEHKPRFNHHFQYSKFPTPKQANNTTPWNAWDELAKRCNLHHTHPSPAIQEDWMKDNKYDNSIRRHAFAAGGTIFDEQLNKMAHYRDLVKHPDPIINNR